VCAGCGSCTIQAGDTFFDLAQARGLSVEAIKAANPEVVPERLRVGQVVNLPCTGGNSGAVNGTTKTGNRLFSLQLTIRVFSLQLTISGVHCLAR
jgi:murein DD-endopeptidase MepM/ murein hydrolase activator NlpD